MFVRVSTVTGAENIDAGVAFLRDNAIPELRGQKGFRGLTVSANRATGDLGIIGLWDSREELEASDSAVSKVRQEAMKAIGGQISVAVMEQLYVEVVAPQDMVGRALRVVQTKMDPAKVDEQIEFFKSTVVPTLRATPGFLAVRNMVDRATGEGGVGTIWTDEKSREAAEASAKERQQMAAERGLQLSPPSYRTVLLSHMQ